MSDDRRLLHTLTIPVRWGDMDALGHVNNTVYFRYCEQARVSWLEEAELGGTLQVGTQVGPVIVNASCTFHRPVVYPATLEVRLYGGSPGRSSFETWYEIFRVDEPETICATGSSKVVWVDHAEGRSTPLPASVLEALPAPE
jgi:acyl-CoA thioester hydrolase